MREFGGSEGVEAAAEEPTGPGVDAIVGVVAGASREWPGVAVAGDAATSRAGLCGVDVDATIRDGLGMAMISSAIS